MNYIKELNSFREWIMLNQLPSNAICLWHTLLSINNATGWKTKFNVPSVTVRQMSGLSNQQLSRARKTLVEEGILQYEAGKKGVAPVYQLNSFYTLNQTYKSQSSSQIDDSFDTPSHIESDEQSQLQDKSVDQSVEHSSKQNDTNSRNILKQKQKQKSSSRTHEKQNPFTIYEQNFGILRPIARESFIAWCEDFGDDVIIYAIAFAVKRGGRTFSYLEEILREWANAKLETVEQVKAYEKQKAMDKKNIVPYLKRDKANNKILFDELREELKI
ncbi:DnaD domain-containing protein [Oceanobacillus bengalensis]|uniref:DnaD domain protein n=1 Tax=Oceanobacillus bengalensis TaxID=1435466 RepID=A0A494Z3G5_9BACI|nr:DnaD domain protein [Oceanobacillus bengalensis]RKQ17069.1 DnaD domain protein [Oceanobacillus bengalensis]